MTEMGRGRWAGVDTLLWQEPPARGGVCGSWAAQVSLGEPGGWWASIQSVLGMHICIQAGEEDGGRGRVGGCVRGEGMLGQGK